MKNYLLFDQVCRILPNDYRIVEKCNRSTYVIYKDNAKMTFINSKVYDDCIYWYSIFVDNLQNDGVEYICFCVGLSGIIILPMSVMNKYTQYADKKIYPNGFRYYIRIRMLNGHYVLYQANRNNIDITNYYIPYK